MTALYKDRDTPVRNGHDFEFPMAAGVKIFAGALVVLDSGLATPGRTDSDLVAVGRAEEIKDNSTGVDGEQTVKVFRGVFRFENDLNDTVDRSHIGGQAYIVDDQTVASNNDGGNRSPAGIIRDVDGNGVWIEI